MRPKILRIPKFCCRQYTTLKDRRERKKFLMEEINWEILRISDDPIKLTLKSGDQLFIVGANGSGKSALIQRFVSENSGKRVKRITAHRQTWLNSGSTDLTPAGRQEYNRETRNYDTRDEARWKDLRRGARVYLLSYLT